MRAYEPYYENSWALVIGIDKYHDLSCPRLSHACEDADSVAQALQGLLNFAKERIVVLKNEEATREAILAAHARYLEQDVGTEDRIIVFYAGHGTTCIGGIVSEAGYLVPYDGQQDRPASLVSWEHLLIESKQFDAKHVLYILDACYSGSALDIGRSPGKRRVVRDLLTRSARQILAAAQSDQKAADGNLRTLHNSLFTQHLLETLREAAEDRTRVLTASEWMTAVTKRVSEDDRSEQTPRWETVVGDGDMVLLAPNDLHLHPGSQDAEEPPETSTLAASSVPWRRTKAVSESARRFLTENGYEDVSSPDFGGNRLTKQLGNLKFDATELGMVIPAEAFLSIVVHVESSGLVDGQFLDPKWVRARAGADPCSPQGRFLVPSGQETTDDALVLFDIYRSDQTRWKRFLSLHDEGHLEFADALVADFWDGAKRIQFVQVVGGTWQFIRAAMGLLSGIDYRGRAMLGINLVGVSSSTLRDFAKERLANGPAWLQPGQRDELRGPYDASSIACVKPNLQWLYDVDLYALDLADIEGLVTDIAKLIARAYNDAGNLRCFTYGTQEFPWQQYEARYTFLSSA